jgi:trigger factor
MEDLGTVLSGCKVGDKKELEGQFPDDYVDESVRGKTGQVELEILDIKRLVLPDLDADFLTALGFESKKELEENVKEILESQKHEEVRHLRKDQVCTYLLDNCKLELPERMSQQQTSRIVARRMLEMARRGVPESELEKHADAIRTGAESDSAKDLNLHFIFEKIADQWDIDVSEDEINGQIAMIARRQNRRFDRVRDDLMRNNSLQPLYVHVRDEKIVDRILEKAAIVESSEKAKPKAKKKTTKKATTKKTATKKTTTKKKS